MASLSSPHSGLAPAGQDRLAYISRARQAILYGDRPTAAGTPLPIESWIERSWRRCLGNGYRPEHEPSFDMVAAPALRHTLESNRVLVQAARPVLDALGRAIANTRYFAILTNQHGVVVDVNGPIDRRDRRADLITRIGTDLSEQRVGTTAISAALTELQPVWLHRGEHFFNTTSVYSCAGAPLFGPDGRCVGMLDLTGIEAAERPELKHLVMQSARSVENALTLSLAHQLVVRLNWPGRALGDEADGLVCVDADGRVTGANQTARQLVPQLATAFAPGLHCNDLFALPYEMLFDAARRHAASPGGPMEVPLWTGLRLHALPLLPGQSGPQVPRHLGTPASTPRPLKELETELIRQAVDDARGNVMKAARTLGISRATVYRKLGNKMGR